MSSVSAEFISALKSGKCCLHPTDTLPGLTAWPHHHHFPKIIEDIKGERTNKSFVCLTPDLEHAVSFWQDLPTDWHSTLEKLWPGPLTVVWLARNSPPTLVNKDGTIAIRCPNLLEQDRWLFDAIHECGGIIPSTSVNKSGEKTYADWHSAAEFLSRYSNIHIPIYPGAGSQKNLPSTIIRLKDGGDFAVLREGALPIKQILDCRSK